MCIVTSQKSPLHILNDGGGPCIKGNFAGTSPDISPVWAQLNWGSWRRAKVSFQNHITKQGYDHLWAALAIFLFAVFSFLVLPPWIGFRYNAWARTGGVWCVLQKSSSQYQQKRFCWLLKLSRELIVNDVIKNNDGQSNKDHKFQLIGWSLFIICAVFYLLASFNNQDILTFVGSLLFLIACIIFLIPLFKSFRRSKSTIKE
jgi:glucan phosphoethanolaminetransferase (alkaline phosphatase superfamily)